jgi:hypothetical protein
VIRNNEMAKLRPDVVLATPGGNGTAHMVAIAKKAGLQVIFLEKMPVLRVTKKDPAAEATGSPDPNRVASD